MEGPISQGKGRPAAGLLIALVAALGAATAATAATAVARSASTAPGAPPPPADALGDAPAPELPPLPTGPGRLPGPTAAPLLGTPVGVAAREFRLTLFRTRVRPGRIRFNVENLGEDRHNLVVRGPGRRSRRVVAASPDVRSGARHTLAVRLTRRGTYTLACTVGDHERLGMRTRLVVTKRP